MTNPRGKLIRAAEVAEIIGVSERQANTLMQQMPRVNIGLSASRPRWAVYENDVQAWLNNREIPAGGTAPARRQSPRRSQAMRLGLLDETGHVPRRRA